VRANGVVVPPPLFDHDRRVGPIAKPLQTQTFIAELAVERFVGAILPRLARIIQRGFNPCGLQPPQDRTRHKLRTVVGTQVAWRTVRAHELTEYVDYAARSNAAGDIDDQALARELIDHRQALQLLPIRARVEDEVVCPDVIGAVAGTGRGRPVATRLRGRRRGTCRRAWRQRRCVRSTLITCPRRARKMRIRRYPNRGYCAASSRTTASDAASRATKRDVYCNVERATESKAHA